MAGIIPLTDDEQRNIVVVAYTLHEEMAPKMSAAVELAGVLGMSPKLAVFALAHACGISMASAIGGVDERKLSKRELIERVTNSFRLALDNGLRATELELGEEDGGD